MFVLSFTDLINEASSNNHISSDCEIVAIGEVKELKQFVEKFGEVEWKQFEDEGCSNWVGLCKYEDEIEENQYYTITHVDFVKDMGIGFVDSKIGL